MPDAEQHIHGTQRLPKVENAHYHAQAEQAHCGEQADSQTARLNMAQRTADQQQNERADRALRQNGKENQR